MFSVFQATTNIDATFPLSSLYTNNINVYKNGCLCMSRDYVFVSGKNTLYMLVYRKTGSPSSSSSSTHGKLCSLWMGGRCGSTKRTVRVQASSIPEQRTSFMLARSMGHICRPSHTYAVRLGSRRDGTTTSSVYVIPSALYPTSTYCTAYI